jgi:hypothetical protein
MAMQVDLFAPAHSDFGLPIYVAVLPAGSIQCVCHDTLDFIQVAGYPSAIRLLAFARSRRIVSRHLPGALDRCPHGCHVVGPTHSIVVQR